MKINSAVSRGQSPAMDRPEVRWPLASPVAHPPCEDHFNTRDVPRQPSSLRSSASLLRYQALQNAPIARADTTPPGPKSADNVLLDELAKDFSDLCISLGMTQGLTQSALLKIAAQPLRGD
ncbi:hypothetical protein [Pseudomonas sp. R76]|uniref:hypothetical protein n=1 Tax=Pseudomonas sp. R76 TaxID=1573711 RepID=UPI0013203E45|nr:hypothetical protein [Pseudomonas sp. R76]QHD06303.1 hypothetical protein PspR76_11425 [Pseudomonas sp. R76]